MWRHCRNRYDSTITNIWILALITSVLPYTAGSVGFGELACGSQTPDGPDGTAAIIGPLHCPLPAHRFRPDWQTRGTSDTWTEINIQFRKDKFDTWNKRKFELMTLEPAVYMSLYPPFVTRIEFIRSKLSNVHVSGPPSRSPRGYRVVDLATGPGRQDHSHQSPKVTSRPARLRGAAPGWGETLGRR